MVTVCIAVVATPPTEKVTPALMVAGLSEIWTLCPDMPAPELSSTWNLRVDCFRPPVAAEETISGAVAELKITLAGWAAVTLIVVVRAVAPVACAVRTTFPEQLTAD